MNIAMVPASTVATLIASDRVGAAWSGVPAAGGVLGTALGAFTLATLMRRRGRRFGLLLGYSVAAVGAGVAILAVLLGAVPLLVVGMALLGVGNGGAQLSRYAAADLYPPERRGLVLGVIVWGGTVGALIGPSLIAPAADVARRAGTFAFAGPYALALLTTVAAAAAAAVLPRLRAPGEPTVGGVAGGAAQPRLSGQVTAAVRLPAVRVALAGMVAAQLAMVAVMTMTPLQLHQHGHGLDVVGWVLSAHLVGMFALSPLSGRIVDRWGGRTAISWGAGTLIASAVVSIAAPTSHTTGLPIALFLLGYGWNLCFVGGSALLSQDLPADSRTQLQGVVDAFVWASSALASLSAGAVFAGGGYVFLALASGLLALSPLAVMLLHRQSAKTQPR